MAAEEEEEILDLEFTNEEEVEQIHINVKRKCINVNIVLLSNVSYYYRFDSKVI